MVGAIFVSMDRAVGDCDAVATENAKGSQTGGLYDGMRGTWVFIWNIVCTGAGSYVWAKPERNDCLDCGRASVGFSAWSQQFFLRNSDCPNNFRAAAGRAVHGNNRPDNTITKKRPDRKPGVFLTV